MKLLSRKTVAERLDVSTKTVARWVAEGTFPPPVVLPSGDQRWHEAVVTGWMMTLPPVPARPQAPPAEPNDLDATATPSKNAKGRR